MPNIYFSKKHHAIFAVDVRGGLGNNGALPWPNDSEDLRRFKQITTDNIIVMGRKTWDSLGSRKPLPNRMNIVVSRCPCWETMDNVKPDAIITPSDFFESIVTLHDEHPDKEIYFIGGKQVLELAHPIINDIQLTVFNNMYDCDVSLDMMAYLKHFKQTDTQLLENKQYQVWTRKNETISR